MSRSVDFFFDRSIPEPNSGCWLWLNAVSHGYGVLNIRGRTARAHREIFKAVHGDAIPPNMDVCHRCDVRSCVNPDHLFLGTRTDNMRDCANKGRIVIPNLRGTQLRQSKLTEDQVLAIRESDLSQRALARRYGVDKGTIAHIHHRKTWRHV